jgi:GntR family transcriptional regulator, transcriptional repressor for pyruvate dehydrogenase complex
VLLTKETLTRQAFDALVAHIIEAGLMPGDNIPSTAELMEQFGTSRSVVREALSALQVCGFVDIRNGRNTVVGELDGRLLLMFMARAGRMQNHPMSALMEVRVPLEIQAARLAAERADDAAIHRIQATNTRMAKAQHDTELYPKLDTEFHAEIAGATNNHILSFMIDSIRAELMTVMVAVREYRETHGLVGQEQTQHEEIARAIRDRLPDKAAQAMQRHLVASIELVHQVEDSVTDVIHKHVSTDLVP